MYTNHLEMVLKCRCTSFRRRRGASPCEVTASSEVTGRFLCKGSLTGRREKGLLFQQKGLGVWVSKVKLLVLVQTSSSQDTESHFLSALAHAFSIAGSYFYVALQICEPYMWAWATASARSVMEL